MAGCDLFTFVTSVGGSLIVAYIGVRYFTGAKIRAERADVARRELRQTVAPWLRAARDRSVGRGRNLQRESRTADTQDGVDALAVLRIAQDLPVWRRLLVRRRCRLIFGDEWADLAEEQVEMSTDAVADANHILTRALFQQLDDGVNVLGAGKSKVSFSTGLIQRVYSSNVSTDAQLLVDHFVRLGKAR